MTNVVPANKIEAIVGVSRDPVLHYGLGHEDLFYILHSHVCRDGTPDLRDCPFSLALDGGVDRALFPDHAIPLTIRGGRLAPRETP